MDHRRMKLDPNNFEEYYKHQCLLNDTYPVKSVSSHVSDNVLDICNADKIDEAGWKPLLQSIAANKVLTFLAVRAGSNARFTSVSKRNPREPAVNSADTIDKLCSAISKHIEKNVLIKSLELENLKLTESSVVMLADGISKNRSLCHVSFKHCPVKDKGLSVLCTAIKNSSKISSIELTDCGVGDIGTMALCDLIKAQCVNRLTSAWKDSLRCRQPNLDYIGGLERVTLNMNKLIADDGIARIMDALTDDIWIRAIDVQGCNVTNVGAEACIRTLRCNESLHIVDIRNNHCIDEANINKVKSLLEANVAGRVTLHHWLESISENCHRRKFGTEDIKCIKRNRVLSRADKSRIIDVRCLENDGIYKDVDTCGNCSLLSKKLQEVQEELAETKLIKQKIRTRLEQSEECCRRLQKLLDERRCYHIDDTFNDLQRTFQKFEAFLTLLHDPRSNQDRMSSDIRDFNKENSVRNSAISNGKICDANTVDEHLDCNTENMNVVDANIPQSTCVD